MSLLTKSSTQDVSKEIEGLLACVQPFQASKYGHDEPQRQALLEASRSLVAALESPAQVNARMSWEEPATASALRLLIDIKVLEHMLLDDKPKKASRLAEACGADPVLVARLLKRVAASSPRALVEEVGPDEYKPTALTRHFADEVNAGCFTNSWECFNVAGSRLPEFIKSIGYRSPADKNNTAWKMGSGGDKLYFEALFEPGREEQVRAFQNHMKFKSMHQNWYDAVPVHEILPADFDSEKVLLVDVGGNAGHDLVGFHNAYPDQKGRLILQDLPGCIKDLQRDEIAPVEPVAHDFFTPQPVEGAKAYYLKMVLHDWPDAQCREILGNIKQALVPGYSKILINEIVILDQTADSFSTAVDIIMMVAHSARERREKEWRDLVESVGLRVVKIWPGGGAPEKLIEVELA